MVVSPKSNFFNAKTLLRLPQSDWLAGVDYDEAEFGNQDNEKDDDYEPESLPDVELNADEDISDQELEDSRDDIDAQAMRTINNENENDGDDDDEQNDNTKPTRLREETNNEQTLEEESMDNEMKEQVDQIDSQLDAALDTTRSHED